MLKTLSACDEFGCLMEENKMYSKVVAISNNDSELVVFRDKKDKDNNDKGSYTTFVIYFIYFQDPEIFIIDNPHRIYEVIDSIKEKIDKEFKVFDKYQDVIESFRKEKEITELFTFLESLSLKKGPKGDLDLDEIIKQIDYKYKTHTDDSKMEMKLGVIINKSLEQIKKCNENIKTDFDELKLKLYSSSNLKNRNLLMMNVEDEIQKEDFKKYVVDKINKEGKLNNLLEEKRKNERIITNNKLKIKKEETFLLETFYCIKCHIRPRNAISKSCNHLVSCDECMEKTKVCPRCGINIDKYDRIYRS